MPLRRGYKKRPTTRMGRARAGRYAGFGKGVSSLVRRRRMTFNPTPTFIETFSSPAVNSAPSPMNIGAAGRGGQFTVRISDIPQIADYVALYRQYRINWVKVMLVPDIDSSQSDPNAVAYNQSIAITNAGMGRIAWVINDTPAQPDPVNESDVLTDNGAKIRPLKSMWSASFKPRPDKFTGDAAGGSGVAVREKFNQWLSFADESGNNPIHRGISFWITQPAANAGQVAYNVYYKVSFSLRDPK